MCSSSTRKRRGNAGSETIDALGGTIEVQDRHGIEAVPIGAIPILAADHKYTRFVVNGKEYLIRESIACLRARLVGGDFIEARRGVLVNKKFIRQTSHEKLGMIIEMADGSKITVSRRRRRGLVPSAQTRPI